MVCADVYFRKCKDESCWALREPSEGKDDKDVGEEQLRVEVTVLHGAVLLALLDLVPDEERICE